MSDKSKVSKEEIDGIVGKFKKRITKHICKFGSSKSLNEWFISGIWGVVNFLLGLSMVVYCSVLCVIVLVFSIKE